MFKGLSETHLSYGAFECRKGNEDEMYVCMVGGTVWTGLDAR